MIQENPNKQNKLELVCIENLVPENHLLRLIDKHIRFNFIYDLVKDLYCEDNGRPALDPVVLFKMLFLGYFYGVRSERQLEREIQVNVAYRGFLGLSLTDEVPDHSTISQNRRRRFKDTDVFQKVFNEIVLQGIEHKLISGKVLYTDSTHLKANANKRKLIIEQVEKTVKDYVNDLEQAIEEDRVDHGKNPLKKNRTYQKQKK